MVAIHAAAVYGVEISRRRAAADGNLVTAPAWPAHAKWLAEFQRVLDAYGRTQKRAA